MKYLIFSDVHGNAFAFKAFLAEIEKVSYDKIIFLGDFIGYYYDSEEIIQACMSRQMTCILGNHDDYFLKLLAGDIEEAHLVSRYGHSYTHARQTLSAQSIGFLRSLPTSLALSDEMGCELLFCHGSPVDFLNGRVYPDTDLSQFEPMVATYSHVILGNTHYKMSREHCGVRYLNPGSLGQQRDGLGCSYMLLEPHANEVEFRTIHYDIEALESQIDTYDNGNERLKSVLRKVAATQQGQ